LRLGLAQLVHPEEKPFKSQICLEIKREDSVSLQETETKTQESEDSTDSTSTLLREKLSASIFAQKYQESLHVKVSGAKETEVAMHTPEKLPEEMEEIDIHAGSNVSQNHQLRLLHPLLPPITLRLIPR